MHRLSVFATGLSLALFLHGCFGGFGSVDDGTTAPPGSVPAPWAGTSAFSLSGPSGDAASLNADRWRRTPPRGVVSDFAGNVYVAGSTGVDLSDGASRSRTDAFVARYGPDGALAWAKPLRATGTEAGDGGNVQAFALAVDNDAVYVVGKTEGDLGPGTYAGGGDLFLAKLAAADGRTLYVRQLGTPAEDAGCAVAVGRDAVHVAGWTAGSPGDGAGNRGGRDAILVRFDRLTGDLLHVRQLGTPGEDVAAGVVVAGDSVYMTGATGGSLDNVTVPEGVDLFLAGFGRGSDNVLFLRQVHMGRVAVPAGMAADASGNLFVGGSVTDAQGNESAFLARFTASGNAVFARRPAATGNGRAEAVALDEQGNVYLAGGIDNALAGRVNAGAASAAPGSDAFLVRYDASGNELWSLQFGAAGDERAFGVAAVPGSGVVVVGETGAPPGGDGSTDGFLARFLPSGQPEG